MVANPSHCQRHELTLPTVTYKVRYRVMGAVVSLYIYICMKDYRGFIRKITLITPKSNGGSRGTCTPNPPYTLVLIDKTCFCEDHAGMRRISSRIRLCGRDVG